VYTPPVPSPVALECYCISVFADDGYSRMDSGSRGKITLALHGVHALRPSPVALECYCISVFADNGCSAGTLEAM
jgi:hypothetical protein